MGKIYYIMGKSSSGKDTIFRELMEDGGFKVMVPYTTRPVRSGEVQGREYFFTDEVNLSQLRRQGKIIEERVYHTVHGPWYYFTVDDGQIDTDTGNYLMIGTLESYQAMRRFFGAEVVVPILIELDDGERLQRALDRERQQEEPRYGELCRRFLADAEDFSEEKIAQAGIDRRFINNDLLVCLEEIRTLFTDTGKQF